MKKYPLLATLLTVLLLAIAYGADDSKAPKRLSKGDLLKGAVVKASCGQCNFEMKGDGCELAVEINGKHYFVAGADIDGHGDAHASHGFCNAIREANVKGRIKAGKFKASSFILLKVPAKE